eukprot:m.21037 g.21037  ORF g.21037 m.21037 type:complete len:552 (-) comp3890_c0_seq1:1101-2756(-)
MARAGFAAAAVDADFVLLDAADDFGPCVDDDRRAPGAIAKMHWAPPMSRSHCPCGREFGVLVSRDNCRCCGQVFCRRCLRFRRPLSFLGKPDPDGSSQPVCADCCALAPPQTIGQIRELGSTFLELRRRANSRRHFNIRKACERVVDSFSKQRGISKALSSFSFGTPRWAQVNFLPPNKIALVPNCTSCSKPFGLLLRRQSCQICGDIYCDTCLFSSLQIYPAGDRATIERVSEARSPTGSAFLSACDLCLREFDAAVKDHWRQVSRDAVLPEPTELAVELTALHDEVAFLKQSILRCVPQFEELVVSITTGSDTPTGSGLIKRLVKLQNEASHYFEEYAQCIKKLRRLLQRHASDKERQVLKSVVIAVTVFYRDQFWLFRTLEQDVKECLPDELAQVIQLNVDLQASRYALCLVKQLAIESMLFPALQARTRHLVEITDKLGHICRRHVEACGDDWASTEKQVNDFVSVSGKEVPLISMHRATPNYAEPVARTCDGVLRTILKHVGANASVKCATEIGQLIHAAWAALVNGLAAEQGGDGDWEVVSCNNK